MSGIPTTNPQEFEQAVLQAEGPVLVDFYADWCGPCQAMTPVLEQFASHNAEAVSVIKVNVDESGELAASYGVRSIPTLVLFRDGEPVSTQVGAQSLSALNRLLQ